MKNRSHYQKKQYGFTIIELMVAMIVGLLVVLAASSGVSFFEANRRNSISGDSAQENALAVAYIIQNDAKMAGYGKGITSCDVANPVTYNNGILSISYYKNPPTCTALTTQNYSLSGTSFSDGTNTLAEGIVHLKFQCGLSNLETDLSVNTWVDAGGTGCGNTTDAKLRAIRVVVIARAANKDKLSDNTPCNSTVAGDNGKQSLLPTKDQPSYTFSNSATAVTASLGNTGLPTGDAWQCYRYKTVGITIPLKNILIQTVNAQPTATPTP